MKWVASIPGRSQLRKTAWYTLSAHASIAPKNLGGRDIFKLVSILYNDVIAQIIAVLIIATFMA